MIMMFISTLLFYLVTLISPASAYIFGADDRMTIPEFARNQGVTAGAIKQKYAATGQLFCANQFAGTVELVSQQNIVVTVGHNFYPGGECNQKPWHPDQCWIEFPLKNKKKYPIKRESLVVRGCAEGTVNDWAVLELIEPATDITPYKIPKDVYAFPPGTEVYLASSYATNFNKGNTQQSRYNFQKCVIRDVGLTPTVGIMHDCDMGPGSSGSALLSEKNGELEVVGLLVGAIMRLPPGSGYNNNNNFATAVPFWSDFLREVERRISR